MQNEDPLFVLHSAFIVLRYNPPSVKKLHTQSRRFLAAAINAILFFILSSLAMLAYPGGTATDTTRPGYSFLTNFFSDLGRTRSLSNQPNPVGNSPVFQHIAHCLVIAGIGRLLQRLLGLRRKRRGIS